MDTNLSEFENQPTENRYVSTAQVSKAIGVSVTTVKRWVDEGILPAHRTPGGHRKLLMADVLRLVRQGNLPQADLSALMPKPTNVDLKDPEAVRRQLLQAVLTPDQDLVKAILFGAYHHGYSMDTLADRVISPVMTTIGHDWERGRIEVMHEHRATQAIMSALYEMRGQLRNQAEKNRPIAAGGAPEHDHYILPSLLAKLVLLDCGWEAINLGPHTPISAFHTALEELNPAVIWLSVMTIQDEAKFLAEYRDFSLVAQRRNVAIVIGGRGITESLRRQMPYTAYGDNLASLASFARNLFPIASRPKRGRPLNDSSDQPDIR